MVDMVLDMEVLDMDIHSMVDFTEEDMAMADTDSVGSVSDLVDLDLVSAILIIMAIMDLADLFMEVDSMEEIESHITEVIEILMQAILEVEVHIADPEAPLVKQEEAALITTEEEYPQITIEDPEVRQSLTAQDLLAEVAVTDHSEAIIPEVALVALEVEAIQALPEVAEVLDHSEAVDRVEVADQDLVEEVAVDLHLEAEVEDKNNP